MAIQPVPQNARTKTVPFFILIAAAVFLAAQLSVLLAAQLFNTTPFDFLTQFKNSLYFPNMNICVVGEIGGQNVLKIFYSFVVLATVLASAGHALFFGLGNERPLVAVGRIAVITSIAGALLLAGFQQAHRADAYRKEKAVFGGKTAQEKRMILFGERYHYAQAVQAVLPPFHRGKMITDLDLTRDPYMFYHRSLSYLLYPNVSLRYKSGAPDDTVVLFYKKDATQDVPEGYRVLLSSEDQNFIVAVNEQALK